HGYGTPITGTALGDLHHQAFFKRIVLAAERVSLGALVLVGHVLPCRTDHFLVNRVACGAAILLCHVRHVSCQGAPCNHQTCCSHHASENRLHLSQLTICLDNTAFQDTCQRA